MSDVSSARRATAQIEHPRVFWLDVDRSDALADYLIARGWLSDAERPIAVERAGEGNMNCTLRVRTPSHSLIVKQGRPWVEKYDHIPAPWGRTAIEGRFYQMVARSRAIASLMPRLIGLDEESQILAIEDIPGSDFTGMYTGRPIDRDDLDSLVAFLGTLHAMPLEPIERARFANREMRALNHEHLFRFPLRENNGLDLDRIAPGLQAAARTLQRDPAYVAQIDALGNMYLEEGPTLLHGDFFPGSWLRGPEGVRVIDPEFCFAGRAEIDVGILMGHLRLARQPRSILERVAARYPGAERLDGVLVGRFAGMEIMRRLIGVAQLPLSSTPDERVDLLKQSRELVLSSDTSWI